MRDAKRRRRGRISGFVTEWWIGADGSVSFQESVTRESRRDRPRKWIKIAIAKSVEITFAQLPDLPHADRSQD